MAELIARETYLRRLAANKDTDVVKIITGMRRSGKSSLLLLFYDYLLAEGVAPENIVIMNFESLRFGNIEDYLSLYEFVSAKIPEKGSMLKEWYITKDRRELKNQEQLEKEGKMRSTSMQATISACVNHPGFKYKLSELKDVGVCEFYDSVKRLQIYENATACLKGLYSGMVDGKKIDTESYNFMRDK